MLIPFFLSLRQLWTFLTETTTPTANLTMAYEHLFDKQYGEPTSVEEEEERQPSIPHVAIFLNAYITVGNLSLQIVNEQFEQIGKSYAAQHNVTVHVTAVGNDIKQIENICQNVSAIDGVICSNATPYHNGGELHTLSSLYDYCQRTTAPNQTRVVYIHNKGSFHPSPRNDRWRRAMTDAVTTEMCLNPPDPRCDACGLTFASPPRMFTILFPGNFFAASCEYVNQLLHPFKYQERMSTVVNYARYKMKFHFAGTKGAANWITGSGRYTPEHWIGSHPNFRPCDVSVPRDYWHWMDNDHSYDDLVWSMIPRNESDRVCAEAMGNPDLRLRTYQYLPGILWRQKFLYNQTPPLETSWMYDWFPDGHFFRDNIVQHGVGFIDKILEPSFDRNATWNGSEAANRSQSC